MSSPFSDHIRKVAEEYLWILSKGYPQGAALKLVGDMGQDCQQTTIYQVGLPDARGAAELCKDMVQMGIEGDAHTVQSPDNMLKKEKSYVICTSYGGFSQV